MTEKYHKLTGGPLNNLYIKADPIHDNKTCAICVPLTDEYTAYYKATPTPDGLEFLYKSTDHIGV